MRNWWAALVVVLALGALLAESAAAQAPSPDSGRGRGGFELGQNYPNPFNPETRIPFELGSPTTCNEAGSLHRVSLRVYNVLTQLVAIPILQGEGAPPELAGRPVDNLFLPCGRFTAYWDGNYQNTTREVASGVYLMRLEVNGRAHVRKMFVTK